MLRLFLEGVVLGLLIAITVGPSFIAVVQTGIDRGFKQGIFISMGIILSDITLIIISLLGATFIYNEPTNRVIIGLIGGIILITYGIVSFRTKPDIIIRRSYQPKKKPRKDRKLAFFIIKGFFLNIANPFLLIFWFTAMSWVTAQSEEGKLINNVVAFFSGTIITVFSLDILKIFIGHRIKKYLKPRILLTINRVVGIGLMVFGIILISRIVYSYF